jgi:hypothetical protein
MNAIRTLLVAVGVSILAVQPAGATFHVMQIEQVIGGVKGNTSVQAVQLRMRALGQNLVSNARLVVRDATGANPVVLIAFPSNVTNSAAGSRILAATANFAAATVPPVTPDFPLTNPIPDSYLAAGTLTYESNTGIVYWRLSWGGAGYTGPGTGSLTNDADGNFDPPFPGPLPSTTTRAVLFQGITSALSTNNASDYALTPGAATFTNNSGGSGTINTLLGVEDGASGGGPALRSIAPSPVRNAMAYTIVLPRAMRAQVRILDLQGRVVGTLVDQVMAAGSHGLAWRLASRGPGSGVYVLELTAGGVRSGRRFVLIR